MITGFADESGNFHHSPGIIVDVIVATKNPNKLIDIISTLIDDLKGDRITRGRYEREGEVKYSAYSDIPRALTKAFEAMVNEDIIIFYHQVKEENTFESLKLHLMEPFIMFYVRERKSPGIQANLIVDNDFFEKRWKANFPDSYKQIWHPKGWDNHPIEIMRGIPNVSKSIGFSSGKESKDVLAIDVVDISVGTKSDLGIQAADLVAGAIRSKLIGKFSDHYDILQPLFHSNG